MARVVFFAFDIAEAAQLRRIDSVRALGHEVASVSFRRANMQPAGDTDWRNLPLGPSSNNRYLLRLARLGRAALRLWRGRSILDGSEVWIARNLDMLLLAGFMRGLTARADTRLVYECLDIHGLFTRRDVIGRIMRWTERRMLARCNLVIVSSPGFLESYFRPVQQIETPVVVLENKLWVSDRTLPRPAHPRPKPVDEPFVLGWVGSLRCSRSLEILAGLARRLGPRVAIVCHGAVHRHAVPDFDDILAAHPNIRHAGPYRYPDDLAGIYAGCDAVWAQDLWQAGGNSDWLLPNRIYEASYFGCPSIAVSGTQTGRRIVADGLGFTVPEATPEALAARVTQLDASALLAVSRHLLSRPATDFRLFRAELAAALSPVLQTPPDRRGAAHEASARQAG